MKYYSQIKPQNYVVSGDELRIYWDIKEVPVTSMNDQPMMQWEANEAVCSVYDNRSQLIEKIIGSVMDTGAEIAAINNRDTDPEEYANYQAFRALAKQLADGWVNR